jgi:hypothetical protein
MAADIVIDIKDDDLMIFTEQIRRRQAGYPAPDNGDSHRMTPIGMAHSLPEATTF